MLFLGASQFLLTRKIFKISPIGHFSKYVLSWLRVVFDKPSGTNRVNADKNQRKILQICHVCLFEGSVYFDKILYTLLACLRVRYILMIFYTHFKRACISLLHIWLIYFTLHHFVWVYRISSWHSSCGVCRSLWPRSIDGSCRRSRWWL